VQEIVLEESIEMDEGFPMSEFRELWDDDWLFLGPNKLIYYLTVLFVSLTK
jgi:hypothetical protein